VIRKAFRMAVDRGREDEYARRHDRIWAELEHALVEHGVATYTIYLDPQTGDLFGYVEVADEATWTALAQTDVCRRWWRFMRDIMPSNPDDSPVSRELREVFHLEAREVVR
jgi:L-rhamnose mutarotase